MNQQCNPMEQAPGSPTTQPCEYLALLDASAEMLAQTIDALCQLLELFEDIDKSPHADLVEDAIALLERIRARL